MNLSLATGAPLTLETWADFVTRLRKDTEQEAAKDYGTSYPIFMVEIKLGNGTWSPATSHFTRGSADAHVDRLKKRFPNDSNARVSVGSQSPALEFNTIKEAILSGRLVYSDKEEGTPA
jgi:hypothetical protein